MAARVLLHAVVTQTSIRSSNLLGATGRSGGGSRIAHVTVELVQIADELYALSPGDFTPARDAKAKELKGSELSGQVKKLKKPSVAAWVLN